MSNNSPSGMSPRYENLDKNTAIDGTQAGHAVVAIRWQQQSLDLLDQRLLPLEEAWISCTTLEDVAVAIREMVVRGAPAIGIAAAYGCVLLMNECADLQESEGKERFLSGLEALQHARPTAVNLAWAVSQARSLFDLRDWEELEDALLKLAHDIFESDVSDNKRMGQIALEYFQRTPSTPFSVLTHCNTGSLATGGYGTALGAIRAGHQAGVIDFVYADETRPWMQGARLTAWELTQDEIPFALNADSASGWLMSNKPIRWVIVGADRITANGDVANKIGTYNLAIIARHHGAKFMVVAPTSTVDMSLARGDDIEIEMRSGSELANISGLESALARHEAINPVFDVTPAHLIDVIVTEKGAIEKPTLESMSAMMRGE